MISALTFAYIACFQLAAVPALIRVSRRKSSADLSVWREWLTLVGVAIQFSVFWRSGASWHVWISPLTSGLSLLVLLGAIYRHR